MCWVSRWPVFFFAIFLSVLSHMKQAGVRLLSLSPLLKLGSSSTSVTSFHPFWLWAVRGVAAWLPPSLQAVGVVYGQGWVSFLPSCSPPFPCNNAVTWWSESAMPFYLQNYSHSLCGKVRLTNESLIPPVDQLLGQSNHGIWYLFKHIRDRNLLGAHSEVFRRAQLSEWEIFPRLYKMFPFSCS